MPKYMTPLAERKEFPQLIVHDGNATADEAEDASDREESRIRNRALAAQRSATATTGHYDTDGDCTVRHRLATLVSSWGDHYK